MSYRINPKKSLGREVTRIARETLGEGTACVGVSGHSLEERIHVVRTTCKKTRALLRLLRKRHPGFYRRENRRLRDLAQRLSGLRDAEVLLAAADRLRPAGRQARGARQSLRRQLVKHRQSVLSDRRRVDEQLAHVSRELQKCTAAIVTWKPHDRDFAAVAAEIEEAYRRARRGHRLLDPRKSGAKYHEWRKAVKAFGYQCRLLRGTWPKVAKAYSDEVDELGELLGREHDLTTLAAHVTANGAGTEPATPSTRRLLKMIDEERAELRRGALALGDVIFAEKSRAYRTRLEAWWRCAAR